MSEKKTAWLRLDPRKSTGQPTLEEGETEDPKAQAYIVKWEANPLRAWIKICPPLGSISDWTVVIENSNFVDGMRVTYPRNTGGRGRSSLRFYVQKHLFFAPKLEEARITLRIGNLSAALIASNPTRFA